jgi:hypothetical protein
MPDRFAGLVGLFAATTSFERQWRQNIVAIGNQ